ncbi:Metallo-hydrolase/oxidoreductase [Ramicandelaber brevisporus]|nr:Metallo-hydrolase/oxidoreductase [Ramicandelaber brevisporus]
MSSKRDQLRITPLGAGCEVGRSCILLEFKGKSILLDAGSNPGAKGILGLPFFDMVDFSKVNLLLVSHFHVDHSAAVPYVTEKTTFKGRVFMTHATKAILNWILKENNKVAIGQHQHQHQHHHSQDDDDILYNNDDVNRSIAKFEAVDYHQQTEVDGIRFTCLHAGHVLGACMFLIEIAGVRILYTGDYSREDDRHLEAGELPRENIDVLICESTFGVQTFEPRAAREARLLGAINETIRKGGRVLMPVPSLGNGQELILVLSEHWADNEKFLKNVQVYFASTLARKCMDVYRTFIHNLNKRIQNQFSQRGDPWKESHYKFVGNLNAIHDDRPCVVLAAPGMMEGGISRALLERWCSDRNSLVLITGYSIEGTMARNLQSSMDEIVLLNGERRRKQIGVQVISFAAHVDYAQNSAFIHEVDAPNLVLVHGEQHVMNRLKTALIDYELARTDRDEKNHMRIFTPSNTDTVRLYFRGEKRAKVVGGLAEHVPKVGEVFAGIVVSNTRDFKLQVMEEEDLPIFTGASNVAVEIAQSLRVPYRTGSICHLEQVFGPVEDIYSKPDATATTKTDNADADSQKNDKEGELVGVRVGTHVEVRKESDREVSVSWIGDRLSDFMADAVVATIISAEGSPMSIRLASAPCRHKHSCPNHQHDHTNSGVGDNVSEAAATETTAVAAAKVDDCAENVSRLVRFFTDQFGDVDHDTDAQKLTLSIDDRKATLDLVTLDIQGADSALNDRVASTLSRAVLALRTTNFGTKRDTPPPPPTSSPPADAPAEESTEEPADAAQELIKEGKEDEDQASMDVES